MTDQVAAFIAAKQAELVSRNTVRVYKWAMSHLPPEPWTATSIQATYVRLTDQKLSAQSIHILDRVFRTFFTWLEAHNGHENPMVKVRKPRKPQRYPRVFSDEEIVTICRTCSTPRERAVVALLLGTGLRLAEIATLAWRDFDGGKLVVRAGKGQKARTVFMDTVSKLPFAKPKTLPEVLSELRVTMPKDKWDSGFLSLWHGRGGPVGYKGMEQMIARLVARAGITGSKRGAHTFRHTYATMYLRAGGSVWALQDQMGHSDLQTTMSYPKLVGRDIEADVSKTRMLGVIAS